MKTRKAALKHSRILESAAKIFALKGYSETTLAEIATEAGTFAGSLYYYFSSKEALVQEILNIGTTNVSHAVMSKVATLPKSISFYDKFRIALETHVVLMLQKDEFATAYWKIIDQIPDDVRQRHAPV